jgi:hypothetical protein
MADDTTPKPEGVEAGTRAGVTPARMRAGRNRGRRSKRAKGRKRGAEIPFPRTPLETALALGNAIQQFGGGQKIRRLTLFEKLDKSPDSGPSRMMVTTSGRYGITIGSYQAEFLELTELGDLATNPETSPAARRKALFDLGIAGVPAFRHLYETNKGKRLPSPEVMSDQLTELRVEENHRKECVDIFLENAKFVGLLRTVAGAERLVPIEQVLESLPGEPSTEPVGPPRVVAIGEPEPSKPKLDKVCFLIAPIGEDASEERKHSDMMLEALISRALENSELKVIRADRIGNPGMISGQVIQYLLKAGLVIADLSFHNPNVFYELAIRHMIGKPTVHIIRKEDPIPFDLKDFRTIVVDTRDKYDLVAKLETYRAEIANHVRVALQSGTEGSNPIRVFAKDVKVEMV